MALSMNRQKIEIYPKQETEGEIDEEQTEA
jgi:hypothetical protein